MVVASDGQFNGWQSLWLMHGRLRLAVTTDRGPRIVACHLDDSPNLFAETPEIALSSPNGAFAMLGGHRFWYAPEVVERTYSPDDRPVVVAMTDQSASFRPPADGAGIVKELVLHFGGEPTTVTVEHRLTNTGGTALEVAPWGLTMVPLGGVTLLPQRQGPVDAHGLLPNRQVVLWPYSDPGDPRMGWGSRIILIHGRPAAPNKLGYRNQHGWLAHWFAGTLFVKRFPTHLEHHYPDGGCNAECYLNDQFMEVESLGPLTHLEAGAHVSHSETWHFHSGIAPITTEEEAVGVASRLGLWD